MYEVSVVYGNIFKEDMNHMVHADTQIPIILENNQPRSLKFFIIDAVSGKNTKPIINKENHIFKNVIYFTF